jgi:chemotaxis protein MotA
MQPNSPTVMRRNVFNRLDLGSFAGVFLAVAAIVGGLVLEGGSLSDIRQVTAAMIVLGGTLGAVLVTAPSEPLMGAMRRFPSVFLQPEPTPKDLMERLVGYAAVARRLGIVALEDELDQMDDLFMKKAMGLAVDGVPVDQLREMLETDVALTVRRGEAEVRVFESAGGYAPTMGIIGAVLGLIQVMKHLENIDEVGRGIAVAFVATVYGVGLANVVLLPAAHKLRERLHHRVQLSQLVIEGVSGMMQGLNPTMLRKSLDGFCPETARKATGPVAALRRSATPAAQRAEGT